jgi:DNA (cytosine-5)-methyltransferase 1
MSNKSNYIELFAGCGGLALGLEAAKFELYFANELSPMAAETYAYNILHEDLKDEKQCSKTLWLNSQFKKGSLKRLRENPYSIKNDGINDLDDTYDISGKMIIGDINSLINNISNNPNLIKKIKDKEIDLVSGGPPCQSFSLAGRRERNNKRNKLPWAFVEMVELTQPKLVMLENVSGILRAFKDGDQKYFAWFEVAKAFCQIGYIPICMHINAKYFGLPQNRPRFILLGIKKEFISKFENDEVIEMSKRFFNLVEKSKVDPKREDVSWFRYFELEKKADINLFENSLFLPSPNKLFLNDNRFFDVHYGIDILKKEEDEIPIFKLKDDPFHILLDQTFGEFNLRNEKHVKNHNPRKHSAKIQNRFRLLRIIEEFDNGTKIKLIHSLKSGSIVALDFKTIAALKSKIGLNTKDEVAEFFLNHKSRKHSQRALVENLPAPAALSIPDDVCHYDPDHNRTLTIREMARIQSFPDWFEFRSKDTTGGTNRRIEVPNYTQVGNAVPPLLGKALGDWLKVLLDIIKDEV